MKKILILLISLSGLNILNATSHLDSNLDSKLTDLQDISQQSMQTSFNTLKKLENLSQKHQEEWEKYFEEWENANLDADSDESKKSFIETMTEKLNKLKTNQQKDFQEICKEL